MESFQHQIHSVIPEDHVLTEPMQDKFFHSVNWAEIGLSVCRFVLQLRASTFSDLTCASLVRPQSERRRFLSPMLRPELRRKYLSPSWVRHDLHFYRDLEVGTRHSHLQYRENAMLGMSRASQSWSIWMCMSWALSRKLSAMMANPSLANGCRWMQMDGGKIEPSS